MRLPVLISRKLRPLHRSNPPHRMQFTDTSEMQPDGAELGDGHQSEDQTHDLTRPDVMWLL